MSREHAIRLIRTKEKRVRKIVYSQIRRLSLNLWRGPHGRAVLLVAAGAFGGRVLMSCFSGSESCSTAIAYPSS